MSILSTARDGYEVEIGGATRRLLLRNGEIERFEEQYAPFGIFALWDQLFGRGEPPQARHCRDLVALALVGGGLSDLDADRLVRELPPSENPRLRTLAQAVLGLAFLPAPSTEDAQKKSEAGSPGTEAPTPSGSTRPRARRTSVASSI